MPMDPLIFVWILVGIVLGLIGAVAGARVAGGGLLGKARREAAQKISDAERDAAARIKDANTQIKEQEIELRAKLDAETREERKEINAHEKRILAREETLDKRAETLEQKSSELSNRAAKLDEREKQLEEDRAKLSEALDQQARRLEEVSGMTADEARKELLNQLEGEVKRDCAIRLKRMEDELMEEADKKAKWVIAQAIQRCGAEHVAESAISVVELPNDEMKGRIIGREGRNIRALENATGINIIIDDTPEAVILSGFDPVRREVARIALTRLLSDGRIHPARIEEMVEKVQEELMQTIKQFGQDACLEVDVHGFHPEIVKLLGRLNYRTSYGQNVLKHSMEVCRLAGIMAAELGADVSQAKRAALIHDMGKAMTPEVEGSHAILGHDYAKKYGENATIANAIGAHHNEMPQESLIAVLVQAADALSAARPGARRETVESYIKRLEQLEHIADSFAGVDKAYALQAGREIRVVVEPEKINDAEAYQLAREVARKVEEDMTYPGQIKVTVIRETRAVETAK